jgi:hypothetical protein
VCDGTFVFQSTLLCLFCVEQQELMPQVKAPAISIGHCAFATAALNELPAFVFLMVVGGP